MILISMRKFDTINLKLDLKQISKLLLIRNKDEIKLNFFEIYESKRTKKSFNYWNYRTRW